LALSGKDLVVALVMLMVTNGPVEVQCLDLDEMAGAFGGFE
jgi:hypothetical protein